MVGRRAYARLHSDERREQLVARATELFATHGYEELSMSRIAREAGISKALLYHYFPGKRQLFATALTAAAEDLKRRTEPVDPTLPPVEQVTASLDAFLRWVDDHREGYRKLIQSGGIPEVREIVGAVRDTTAQRILEGLGTEGERPATRTAVHAWLWFLDGACLDWLDHGRDVDIAELRDTALGALFGALAGAGTQLVPAGG
jgi:AcrR family transcriptional regulator